jgi:hypothetical protein
MATFFIVLLILGNLALLLLCVLQWVTNKQLEADILALETEVESANGQLATVRRNLDRCFGVHS